MTIKFVGRIRQRRHPAINALTAAAQSVTCDGESSRSPGELPPGIMPTAASPLLFGNE